MSSSTLFFFCEICVSEHGPYQVGAIKVVKCCRFFTVLQYVFLVLMVAMGPHPCPFPSPSPFFHQVQAAEQLACTCGKRGRGGEGAQLFLFAQNSVVGRPTHEFIYTLFFCEICVAEHGNYQFGENKVSKLCRIF